ncbi:MAG: OmpA family protein [Pseudomonadota bacterium]
MTLKSHIALPLFAGMLALSACSDPQFFDQNDPNARAKENALIGAVIGGTAGAITGDRGDAVAGLVGGAIVGGIVGNILDQQAEELRQELGSDEIQIVNTGDELIVTMPQDILFAFDSDQLSGGLQQDLRALSSNLQRYPDSNILIYGHTDNVGEASYNYDLSERRARRVSGVLSTNGVEQRRLRAIGVGEDQPVASNLSDAGRAQNRRVDIVIRPYT